jgi:hypothetical protein
MSYNDAWGLWCEANYEPCAKGEPKQGGKRCTSSEWDIPSRYQVVPLCARRRVRSFVQSLREPYTRLSLHFRYLDFPPFGIHRKDPPAKIGGEIHRDIERVASLASITPRRCAACCPTRRPGRSCEYRAPSSGSL